MSVCVVSPPAGPISSCPVSSCPLLQPQHTGTDPRPLPRIVPLQLEEPDHKDPAGEQVRSHISPSAGRSTPGLIAQLVMHHTSSLDVWSAAQRGNSEAELLFGQCCIYTLTFTHTFFSPQTHTITAININIIINWLT